MKTAAFLISACVMLAQSKLDQAADQAFAAYWTADLPSAAAKAADAIAKSGVTFDEALRRLKAGRKYTAQKSGVVILENKSNGKQHFYSVNVPANYDPQRKYQVRFQLHGGVGGREDNKPRGNGEIGALAGAEQFYVIPYAWNESPWWDDDQVFNLHAIVDSLKRTYNIDENRVALAGVSDGATGAYYIAMRDTTPYASIEPLNGFLMVLSNSEIDDGRIFPNNLRAKPFYVVNGGKDRLYPTGTVEPFTKHLMANGVTIDYHPQPEGEHNTRWWPELKDGFEAFVAAHPRNPHPEKISWQSADKVHNRAHWLVIEEYGVAPNEHPLADLNAVNREEGRIFDYTKGPMFPHPKKSGRVDLSRNGNTVEASTFGVSEFTLLLSPDAFDLAKPVKVVANGKQVFEGRVQPSLKTLLDWAARDNDRTMLYAAELKIKLPK